MSADEIVDVLNEDGEVIDTITREQAERDNHTTENVLILVFNSKGQVWTQLRPKHKKHYPGVWDISACGGVISGETPEQAAQRETQEEMGITVDLQYAETFLNVFPGENGETRSRLSHLYIGVSDKPPVITHEVDDFRCWDPKALREQVEANPDEYVPSFIVELDKALDWYS